MKIAVFIDQDSLCLFYPTEEALKEHSVIEIVERDIPEGCPYWFVDESEIPTDRTFRDAWEIPEEWGAPDGYGSQYNTFEELDNAKN